MRKCCCILFCEVSHNKSATNFVVIYNYFCILLGCQLVWESYKLDPYVQKFAEQVFNFEEKVEDLLEVDDQISNEVRMIDTCQYNFGTFSEIISKLITSHFIMDPLVVTLLCW